MAVCGTVSSPGHTHGNPTTPKGELFGRKRQSMFRVLIMRRMSARQYGFSRTQQKEPKNNVFVPLVVYWLAHILLCVTMGRTLRREEQDAGKLLVCARPRRHERKIWCGCWLRLAMKNGGDFLPTERQAGAKLVMAFQKWVLSLPSKCGWTLTIAWML